MTSDPLSALIDAAITKRANDSALPRMPHRTPDTNNPFQPEGRRSPRSSDPTKWSPPAYRDRDAERVVGRLSKKGRTP